VTAVVVIFHAAHRSSEEDSKLNIVTRFFTLITAAAALAACGGGSDSPETAPSNQSPTPGTVALEAATYSVEQSAGTVTLSVARIGGSSGAASVTYATSDGTGKAGTDYTATNGTFTWTDGDAAAKTVAVPISGTTGFSGTKTFSFTLSAVSGAALGSPASATVTINGSGAPSDGGQTAAGTLRFSANTYSAQQTAGTVTVTVNRAGGSTGAVTVQYATSNGTASAGTHYTTKTGTLSWAAGSTTAQTFSIPLATSPAFSGSKSFTVTLSAPTGGATLGTPATSTVSIVGATPATLSVRVQGNKLIDAQGNTLQLRGVNTASLEFWPIQSSGSDYWGGQYPNLDAIKAWGANTIRVPLNSTSYLGLTCYNMNDGSARKADPQSKYPAVVKEIVDAATARGLYVILDLHKNAPKGTVPGKTGKVQTCSISSTQQQMADADNSEAFWTAVATDFQGYPNVIFDLYNEPYFDSFAGVANDAGKWKALRDGGVSNFYYASNQTVNEQTPTAGMQAMLNAVRATGATNVVMSAGISWAQDFSQWVQYKPNDPLGQLAMSWHAYPYYGAAFGTPQYTQPGLGAVSYDWAQAALDAGFPIIIGETGDRSVNGTTSAPFLAVLLPWADSHKVSVVGWGWNAWGEASANLIKDASGTPTDGYGVAFKAWLVNHP
jgi:endoglucanase